MHSPSAIQKIMFFLMPAFLVSSPLSLAASEKNNTADPASDRLDSIPTIEVIGQSQEAMDEIPGSGEVISREQLQVQKPVSLQDALRSVPGVNIRQEDGSGILPSIGIRGLNPDRSEKLLILEDGVPAGFAPYTENAAYYIPPIERMDRVEILKGSGSILYGPQTVGGVLNLITPDVPEKQEIKLRLQAGSDAYLTGLGSFGKTWGKFGLNLSVLHKQGNGFREANHFDINNFHLKMKYKFSPNMQLVWKNNYYMHEASMSYLGLTQGLYEQNPDFNPAPFDRYEAARYDTQLTLQHFFTDRIQLLTNAYYWKAHRNWNRQDFARNNGFAPPPDNTQFTHGDPSLDGSAIYMRESYGSRDRSFQAVGIEPRLLMDYDAFGKTHHLQAGVRLHYEHMLNQRNNRSTLESEPTLFESDVRKAYAFAAFAQNTFRVTDNLSVIPGFRLEYYKQTRDIERDLNLDINASDSTIHTVLIPGLGLTYQLPANTTLFAGFHRGFAPPRTSQAISAQGQDLELKAEYSWNYELGARTQPFNFWQAEATLFYMDFRNQVVPVNESGGASTLDINVGQSRHLGVELASSIDLFGPTSLADRYQLYLDTKYTFSDSKNTTDFGAFEDKDLPYAPHHLASAALRYAGKAGKTKGLNLGTEAIFVSSQYADQANTELPSADGTNGKIPSHWIVNAYASYDIPKTNLSLSVNANNVFDNRYITSRAPSGIFAGPGLQVLGGINYEWK